jgi:hypothetical protein
MPKMNYQNKSFEQYVGYFDNLRQILRQAMKGWNTSKSMKDKRIYGAY